MLASVRVRRAQSSDAEALAEIVAAVAEEGLIATEPPVDVSARAERIRTTMDAGANGAHKIELEVWPENADAIAIYERAGFEPEGLRRNHYRRRDGSLRSALLMACAVEPRGEER